MISYGHGDGEGLSFGCHFLGDRVRLLQCLQHAYLEVLGDPLKMVARPIVVCNQS